MTIHLGVVGSGSRTLDSLTPHCQLGLAGSYFPLCLCLRHGADKNIHNSRQADLRGVRFQCFISLHSQKLQLSWQLDVVWRYSEGTAAQERKLHARSGQSLRVPAIKSAVLRLYIVTAALADG